MLLGRLTKNEKPVKSSENSGQESIFKYGLRFIRPARRLLHSQIGRGKIVGLGYSALMTFP